MKVIFLDFDGVLNSEGSFLNESRIRERAEKRLDICKVNETLCHVCTSNFQYILDQYPEVKIVISSTWRELYDLEWLKAKLASYYIDSSRVIDKTPIDWGGNRGLEIASWLSEHPEVTHYIVIDDNTWGIPEIHGRDKFVQTSWESGMTWTHVMEAVQKLKTPKKKKENGSD